MQNFSLVNQNFMFYAGYVPLLALKARQVHPAIRSIRFPSAAKGGGRIEAMREASVYSAYLSYKRCNMPSSPS
jgi:hypothetical protein